MFLTRFAAKKEAEECRQKLTDLLNYAKSIARLTPALEKEFLEVCIRYLYTFLFLFLVLMFQSPISSRRLLLGEIIFCCLLFDFELDTWKDYMNTKHVFLRSSSSIIKTPKRIVTKVK